MIHREKRLGRGRIQGITHELEDVGLNRDPTQLPGHQRRPVGAVRASGLFDECAEELDDVVIVQSFDAQLVAGVGDHVVQRRS